MADETDHPLIELEVETDVQIRDASKREIDIRVMPWNKVISHQLGLETFERGAFRDINPKTVLLKGVDPEGTHRGPIIGSGRAIHERDDGAYMTFKVSSTAAGDDNLALLADGIQMGASPGFYEVDKGSSIQSRSGKKVRVHQLVGLEHVALTYRPAYKEAAVIAMRSSAEGEGQMAEPVTEPTAAPAIDFGPLAEAISKSSDLQQRSVDAFADRVEKLEERYRSEIVVPGKAPEPKKATIYNWASWAVRTMLGDHISQKELQERALDDIVTPQNPGLVPDALRADLLIGIINQRRPFLESTTQIAAPSTGMSIVVPVLSQRSTVAVQSSEKTEIDSTAMKVTTSTFDAVSVFGGADVSIQMIRRADPSFMDLLMRDLGHAYAAKADSLALTALFTAGTTPGSGNLDPENLTIGEAWENSMSATDEAPDTIWLSAAGVSAFINAKNDGSNAPLYFTLQASFAAGNGPGGSVSALRPVYVPALDGTSVDVMIGPRSGFAWAEDGDIVLQADNPTLAGRDIALGGILFFIPRYPAAFTTYDLGS